MKRFVIAAAMLLGSSVYAQAQEGQTVLDFISRGLMCETESQVLETLVRMSEATQVSPAQPVEGCMQIQLSRRVPVLITPTSVFEDEKMIVQVAMINFHPSTNIGIKYGWVRVTEKEPKPPEVKA